MSHSCPGCTTVFARSDTLKRHLDRFPGHSKLTISEVCKEHRVPRSPITDALCDADLVYLPAAGPERLELFGDFVPRISSVRNWKSSYSFDEIRHIMLSNMLQSNDPVSVSSLSTTSIANKDSSKYGIRKELPMTIIQQHRSFLVSMRKRILRRVI